MFVGWRSVGRSADGPTRCVINEVPNSNGIHTLLGTYTSGRKVIVVVSHDTGATWQVLGSVVSCADGSKEFGDPTLLLVEGVLFCAFRIHCSSDDFEWQVVVCKSKDDGASWSFDSVVDTTPNGGLFVGAPCLLARDGVLQVYYDKEFKVGNKTMQWITLREKPLFSEESWTQPEPVLDDVTISKISDGTVGLLRDGMAQAMTTADGILVVMETVDIVPPHQNIVRGVRSVDGGKHWLPRFEIARGKIASDGSFYNAYNPCGVVVGGGSVWVVYCTDEDYPAPPDASNTPVRKRRASIKIKCSSSNTELWSQAEPVFSDANAKCYNPGLVVLGTGGVLCTVDRLDGTREMLSAQSRFRYQFSDDGANTPQVVHPIV